RAAKELEAVDPELARATYLEALSAAMFAGRLAGDGNDREDRQAALAGPPPAAPAPPAGPPSAGVGDPFHPGVRGRNADPQGGAGRLPPGDRPAAAGGALAVVL